MPRPQNPIAEVSYATRFAARLRAARSKCGRTAAQCAELAQVGYATWLDYESGRHSPRLDGLPAIAAAVASTPAKLLPPDAG